MRFAFQIAEKLNESKKNGMAGRGWYEGFLSRHPHIRLQSSQPLSRCRAICSNKLVIEELFSKLGAICGRLNQPMQIYNADETLFINVITNLMYTAERRKTHTVLTCGNASGSAPTMATYDDLPTEETCSHPLSRRSPFGLLV